LQKGINTTDEQAVREEIADVDLLLTDTSVLLHGIDVTEAIKREEIGMASSTIGMFASARSAMVRIMRKIAAEKMSEGIIVVTEGRDMATTVFPHAAVKVFLTAEPAVRAKRRLEQAQQRGETHLSFEQVLADTIKRDKQDTEREISPLAKEPEKTGYGVIDSSFLTAAETIEWILAIIKQKGL
jgi:cytidylate kinase